MRTKIEGAVATRFTEGEREIDIRVRAADPGETRVEDIDAAFCKPGFFEETSESKVRSMQQERDKLAAELEKLMAEWEELEATLENGGS